MKNQKKDETRPKKESLDELAQRVYERICATYTNDAPDIVGNLETLVSRIAADLQAESGQAGSPLPADEELETAFYRLSAQQQEFISLQMNRGMNSQAIAKLKGLPHAFVQKVLIDGYVQLRQQSVAAHESDDERKDS